MNQLKGRVIKIRRSKEKVFIDLNKGSETNQLVIKRDYFESEAKVLKIGDIISVEGVPEEGNWYGRPSFSINQYELLTRPARYHKKEDPEQVDIISKRCSLDSIVRSALDKEGFVEVSTNILSRYPGCSRINPFKTEDVHNRNYFLRFTIDLELKRQMAKLNCPVFEIGKVFRNMSQDRKHSVYEYRVAEGCIPYTDLDRGIELIERIFIEASKQNGYNFESIPKVDIIEACNTVNTPEEDTAEVYAKKIKTQAGPLFTVFPPKEWSPLAEPQGSRAKDAELVFGGVGCIHIYQSNSNYNELKSIFESQEAELKNKRTYLGIDKEFLSEIENGIPPNVSFCIGLDRLLMVFSHKTSTSQIIFQ